MPHLGPARGWEWERAADLNITTDNKITIRDFKFTEMQSIFCDTGWFKKSETFLPNRAKALWLSGEQDSQMPSGLRTTSGDLAEPCWFLASTQTRSSSWFLKCFRPIMSFELICSLPVGPFLKEKKRKDRNKNIDFFICQIASLKTISIVWNIFFYAACLLGGCSLPVQGVICVGLVSWTWRPLTVNVWGAPCHTTWSVAKWRLWKSRGI